VFRRRPDSDTLRPTTGIGMSGRRIDPDIWRPVLARVNDRRRLSSKCSLYSVGPS
jgi:hypothetical protein